MPRKDSPSSPSKASGRSTAAQTGGKGSAPTEAPKGATNAAGKGTAAGTAAGPSRPQASSTATQTTRKSRGTGSRSQARDAARESAPAGESMPSKRKGRQAYRLLRRAGQEFDIDVRGIDPVDAMQLCLDRAVELWKFAMARVDAIEAGEDGEELFKDTIAGRVPHHWIQQEDRMRAEVSKLSQAMNTLDLAGRAVRVREAEVALLITSLRDAAKDAGLSEEQTRALGAALRNRVGGTREGELEMAASSAGSVGIGSGGQVA